MTRSLWFLIFGITLASCGSDSADSLSSDQQNNDDSQWLETDEEVVDTGSLSIDLPGEHGSGNGLCSMNIIRASNKSLASINLTLDVIGEGCDGMGNCSNPNMQSGQLMYSGGIDGEQAFATMVLNYEPPGDADEELLWMYNALYKSEPFSRFGMWVDGEPFNVLTSDAREAEDYAKGPHVWATRIEIEADMLRSSDTDDGMTPGLQTRGKISYEGHCEMHIKYMQL